MVIQVYINSIYFEVATFGTNKNVLETCFLSLAF